MNIEELQLRLHKTAFILGKAHILSMQMLDCGKFPSEQKAKFFDLFTEITNVIGELYYKDVATDTESESAGNKVYNKFEEAVFGL